MVIFKRLVQFKIYRRIILSYSMMFALAISLLSCVLFSMFSSSASREIDRNARAMLAQTSYASEVVYNQVTSISCELLNYNEIISFFYSGHNDKIVNYRISLLLTKVQNVYPFIRSIGVHNMQTGISIDTMGIPIQTDFFKSSVSKYVLFFPRKVAVEGFNRDEPYNLITFVLFPDYSMTKPSNSAIAINIDESYILNTISSISGISPESTTLVMDSHGFILSHTDPSVFMEDLSGKSHIRKILEDHKSQGSFIADIDEARRLVTYVNSNKLNWYFITIKTYNKLLQNIYQLRNITFLITLCLIVFGIISTIYLAGPIYNPMKALVEKVGVLQSREPWSTKFDEYEFLSDAFSRSQEAALHMRSSMRRSSLLLRESYLLNLLKGNQEQAKSQYEICEDIRRNFTGPYFCVLLFKIDGYEHVKQTANPKDQSLYRFIICNIAQELLSRSFRNEPAVSEEDEAVVLMLLDEKRLSEDLYLILTEIQDAIKDYFNFTVSVCIGDILSSISEISGSYKTLQEYSRYRLFYGRECILDSQEVNVQSSKSILYPFELEKKIMEALPLSNEKVIRKYIGEFIKEISTANYLQAVSYANQLLSSMLKHFHILADMQDSGYTDYFHEMDRINHAETIEDISSIMMELSFRLRTMLDEKNKSLNAQKYLKLVDDAKEYVQRNYSDPNLSIELVSGAAGLSSGYLGKIFKNTTGISFGDYVNKIRLEKARELLITTTEPASRICRAVGIYNVTYFSTLFKKTFGMTPSQYRTQGSINGG